MLTNAPRKKGKTFSLWWELSRFTLVIAFLCSLQRVCSVTQWYTTVCDAMHWSPPGSSVHGLLQAVILEWVAISSSSGSSQPRGGTHVSCVFCNGRQILCHWVTWGAHILQQLAIIMLYLVSPVLIYIIIGSLYLLAPSFNPVSFPPTTPSIW